VFRLGELFVKGHPKITDVIDPLDWFPEELYCPGFRDAPTVLEKSIAELLETLMAILYSLSHRSKSLRSISRYLPNSAG
jgi:hypothetical protein